MWCGHLACISSSTLERRLEACTTIPRNKALPVSDFPFRHRSRFSTTRASAPARPLLLKWPATRITTHLECGDKPRRPQRGRGALAAFDSACMPHSGTGGPPSKAACSPCFAPPSPSRRRAKAAMATAWLRRASRGSTPHSKGFAFSACLPQTGPKGLPRRPGPPVHSENGSL